MRRPARTSPASGSALVLCHRWFASGEGWAWADAWGDASLNKALGLLKEDLALLRRPEQRSRYPLRRGILLVHTTDDLECPDPLARPRHPVLITGVFVPGVRLNDCSPSDEEAMLDEAERACRQLDSSGSKPQLSVALPARLASVRRRRNALKISGFLALGVIALAGGYEGLVRSMTPDANEKNIQAWATAVKEPLQKWGVQDIATQAVSGDGDTQSRAINEFLGLLARQKGWGRLDGRQVDVEFLRRPPETAAKVESNPKEADVRSVMLGLLKCFSASDSEKMKDQPAEKIVAEIARQMDCRAWYTGEARKQLFDGRSEPAGNLEREYLYRFCPPSAGINDGGLSRVLHEIMLNQWGLRGLTEDDLHRRPWFIVGSFFEFVSASAASDPAASQKQPAAEAHLQQNSTAVMEWLRKHLPAESVVPRSRLREDNLELVIRDGLRALAMNLDIPTNGRDDRTVLEDVRVRLKQVAESALEALPENDMAPSTRRYLEHLACRTPTPQKGTPQD